MKKIGLLALALVLALGTLGVGYAMWFEDLIIDGTVYTGDLDADWSIETFGDDETKDSAVHPSTSWKIPGKIVMPDAARARVCEYQTEAWSFRDRTHSNVKSHDCSVSPIPALDNAGKIRRP